MAVLHRALTAPMAEAEDVLQEELGHFFGQDIVMDEILHATLRDRPQPGIAGAKKRIFSFVILGLLIAFTLWYVLAFGIYHGDAIVGDFLSDFWTAQGLTFFVFEPMISLGLIALQVAVLPVVLMSTRWLPCFGTRTEAIAVEQSHVLRGRIENVTLLQATGAAAGVGATESLVLFSALSALAPAFLGVGGGGLLDGPEQQSLLIRERQQQRQRG